MTIVDYFVDKSWTTGIFNNINGRVDTMNYNKKIINTSSGFYINIEDVINYLTSVN